MEIDELKEVEQIEELDRNFDFWKSEGKREFQKRLIKRNRERGLGGNTVFFVKGLGLSEEEYKSLELISMFEEGKNEEKR